MSLPLKIKRPHTVPAEVHSGVISFHHAVKSLLEQPALGEQRLDRYLSNTGTAVLLLAATPKHHLMTACRTRTGLRNGTTCVARQSLMREASHYKLSVLSHLLFSRRFLRGAIQLGSPFSLERWVTAILVLPEFWPCEKRRGVPRRCLVTASLLSVVKFDSSPKVTPPLTSPRGSSCVLFQDL